MNEHSRRLLCAAGVSLALLGLYWVTTAGRIDIIDGQWRYEAAKNWLRSGEPSVRDPFLLSTHGELTDPRSGKGFAVYNAAPSITPMPLMLISRLLPGHTVERDQFAFSLAGPLLGALVGGLLILGYGMLGIGLRRSLLYTGIFCLATLWWPASLTVFDQNQHAALLFGAVLLAWHSGRRRSIGLASLAGVLGGLLLNYQESYGLLLPVLGAAVLASPAEGSPEDGATLRQPFTRAGLMRYAAFGLGCCVGLGLFLAYNDARLGSPLAAGRYGGPAAGRGLTWGDPLAGLLSLACSPGKGIFWFSPPLILALFGARKLFARAPVLAMTVAAVSAVHLLVIIQLAFFGGDWCWGPRYVVTLLPLWALALPFAARARRLRPLGVSLAVAGLAVQVMGISLDQHGFFYERNFPPQFWAADPWVYFKQSQLISRPTELYRVCTAGLPADVERFSAAPNSQATYCPFGPRRPEISRTWMRRYGVFFLPRPWPGWIWRVRPERRPVEPVPWLVLCISLLALGSAAVLRSLRSSLPLAVREGADGERWPALAHAGSYSDQG